MEDLRGPSDRFRRRQLATRDEHEFLEVERIPGVDAAVQDIHHQRRQGRRASGHGGEIAEQGYALLICRSSGGRHRHGENRVGSQARLVGRAVQRDEPLVDVALVIRREAPKRPGDCVVNMPHGVQHTFTAISLWIPVPQLVRFERTGRRS